MSTPHPPTPPAFRGSPQWQRTSRGHQKQFIATDAEVHSWLVETTHPDTDEFLLIAHDAIRVGRTTHWSPVAASLRDFLRVRNGPSGPRVNFWLWSRTIGPPFAFPNIPTDAECSLAGLVLLQPTMNDDGIPAFPGRIAIVTQIAHTTTNEVVDLDAYKRLFHKLRRRITKDLVHRTVIRFPDGRECADELVRMSAGAAALWQPDSKWVWRPLPK